MRLCVVIWLVCAVALVHAQDEDDDEPIELPSDTNIQTLTTQTFDEVIKPTFYAPWCGHCYQFAPDFQKFADAMKEFPESLVIARYHPESPEDPIAQRFDIDAFPTTVFRPIPKDSTVAINATFDDEHTALAFTDWVFSPVENGNALPKAQVTPKLEAQLFQLSSEFSTATGYTLKIAQDMAASIASNLVDPSETHSFVNWIFTRWLERGRFDTLSTGMLYGDASGFVQGFFKFRMGTLYMNTTRGNFTGYECDERSGDRSEFEGQPARLNYFYNLTTENWYTQGMTTRARGFTDIQAWTPLIAAVQSWAFAPVLPPGGGAVRGVVAIPMQLEMLSVWMRVRQYMWNSNFVIVHSETKHIIAGSNITDALPDFDFLRTDPYRFPILPFAEVGISATTTEYYESVLLAIQTSKTSKCLAKFSEPCKFKFVDAKTKKNQLGYAVQMKSTGLSVILVAYSDPPPEKRSWAPVAIALIVLFFVILCVEAMLTAAYFISKYGAENRQKKYREFLDQEQRSAKQEMRGESSLLAPLSEGPNSADIPNGTL